jgi:hypothetical protein
MPRLTEPPDATDGSFLSCRRETPLWLYLLAESASRARGEQLGPCGGRIVAEVLIGILEADRGSYRANEPGWTPTLPTRGRASASPTCF